MYVSASFISTDIDKSCAAEVYFGAVDTKIHYKIDVKCILESSPIPVYVSIFRDKYQVIYVSPVIKLYFNLNIFLIYQ